MSSNGTSSRCSSGTPLVLHEKGTRPMDVTQALLGEHGIVHLLVEQLAEALDRYSTIAELRAAAEPLAITLLGHARIEDETLFQPYEKHTSSLGPLKCLRHEHELMDQQIRAMFRL